MKFLGIITFAFALFLNTHGSLAQSSTADNPHLKRVYLMGFADSINQLTLMGANFCSVENTANVVCGKKRNDPRNLVFNHETIRNFTLRDYSNKRGTFNYAFMSQKPRKGGTFAMVSSLSGKRWNAPDGVTFLIKGRPGTVYVISPNKFSAKQGVAEAKKIISSHPDFGDRLSVLDFVPIKAAEMQCDSTTNRCTVGREIDPRQIGKKYKFQ